MLSQKSIELDLLPTNYEICEHIDAGVKRLVRWIKEVVAQHNTLSKSIIFSVSWWFSELTQLVTNARRVKWWHERRLSAEAERVYLEALTVKGEAIRKANAVHFK